jgi:CheY-like chemotaxis protein
LVEQLRVFRFDTHSVDSGAAAIAELSAATTDRAYDLVLMPGLDGIETIRRIRSSTSIPCPAFVIMSNGSDGEEVLAEAKQNGVEGIVLNPVTPSLLLDTVCNALGHESFARRRHRTEAPMSTPHGEPLRGARVLLVEDNEINRVLAIELLRQVGTEVVEASNGRDALVELAQSTFDAVLMDIQMPEMNGWQATERIRENPNHRTLPIIALSAHCMAGFGEECLQGGMNDYLSKPIDADELYRMLRRWIPRKTAADMVDPENV